nr:molybdopterin-dependent oxidoreductase [Parafrankia soli]
MKVDGELRPTTWEECLDDLGARLRNIIERYGPESVGVFFGSGIGMDAAGYRMAQALHAAIGTPAKFSPMTIDGTAKVLTADLVGGSPALSGRPDYDNASFVLNQLEAFKLPISPPEGSFGPGPRSRPETQSFLGEWPCAVLADEIRAGNIRAVLNLGGHLVAAFPDTETLVPALRDLELFATIEIIGNETTALSTHVLPTKDQLERADVSLWDFLIQRVAVQHTPAVVEPVGDRRSVVGARGTRTAPRLPARRQQIRAGHRRHPARRDHRPRPAPVR